MPELTYGMADEEFAKAVNHGRNSKYEETTEYSKPKTKKGKCSNCGADIEIGISRYNGHKHYHCDKCGMSMME